MIADGAAGVPASSAAEGICAGASGAAADAVVVTGDHQQQEAIVGQELVPFSGKVLETGEDRRKEPDERLLNEGAFQTPAEKKLVGTPSDQLQLQKTPWNGKNEDSENRSGKEENMDSLPNGPPTSFGPSSSPQMPLFSP